ncbi:hypothetical protein BC828DRAFT_407495 [Blastocladiella britannica]|nr:hypothetical protein BC828DRAFT_407495 [Blastocladiella britannica]
MSSRRRVFKEPRVVASRSDRDLVNAVMTPALACRSRIHFFRRSTLDDLDRKSLGAPSTVPNAIAHPSFLALESVTGALVAQHFTDLSIANNDPSRGGVPVLVELALLQMETLPLWVLP